MKRILLALFALTLLAVPVRAAAEYTFTIANHIADEAVESRCFYFLADQVKERSGGRLQINVSTAAALGGQREIIEAVNFGAIEMGMGEGALYSNYHKAFGVMSLPFIHPSGEKYAAAVDGKVGKRLTKLLEEHTNMTIIAWLDGVRTRDVYTLNPIENLEAMKGLKIRTPQSPVYVATFRAFGANPTPISAPEMYTALQQGVVGGMEGTTETAVTYGISELAKNCLETHHIYNETSVVINRDALNELPEDLQKILKECAYEMVTLNRKESGIAGDKYKQQMLGTGVKFYPIDLAKAKEMVEPVYKEYIGGDAVSQEIFDLLMEVQK